MANVRYNRKKGKYFLDWYENGRRRRLFTGNDEKHAKKELEKLNARLLIKKMGFAASSATIADPLTKSNTLSLSLEKAIEKYLAYSKTHHSPKNYQGTTYMLNGPFLSFLRRRRIHYSNQVTAEVIEDYKASRLKGESKSRKIKPATVNRHINILKPMFRKLTEWGYLERSPLEKISKIKVVEAKKGKCLSQIECHKLLEASKTCNCGSFYYIIVTALGTGLRRSELKNLKASDVDLEKREIKVINRGPEARTKTGKDRVVDLSENHVQILSRYKSKGEYMFDFTNFRRNWDRTKKASGVTCRFHDLRHTFITICLQKGIQPTSVADWVGHTDLQMIMTIYKHLQRDHLKEEINKLNGFYGP